ncbi:hypothetical protein FOG51_00282 [Hanseniaspora uvarum]|jgi:hypothetical protein|nr:hypothetical protein FOG51_00282 [Hanseniaspora uvarum]GMM43039.1 Rcf3 protein [Hanseniaspora uvarum]
MSYDNRYVHDDKKRRSAFEISSKALILGAIQGSVLSITAHALLLRFSPGFRNLRTPLKCAFHTIIIGSASGWKGERSITEYRHQMSLVMKKKREKMVEEAAEKGIFIEE